MQAPALPASTVMALALVAVSGAVAMEQELEVAPVALAAEVATSVAATRVAATPVAGVAPKGVVLPREQSSQVAPLQSERPKRRRHPRPC